MSNTLFVGKVYYCFDELPSTNDWAANLVAQGAVDSHLNTFSPGYGSAAKTRPPEGTVVRAANQTAGRGQVGSRWHSRPGENLLLSIILYPSWLEVQAQFYLSMAMALGLRDLYGMMVQGTRYTAQGSSPVLDPGPSTLHPEPCTVKWPNDLFIGDKKAAGILIQNSLSGSNLQSSIVGIGLNVNQLEFSNDLPNATSLTLSTGQSFDLDQLAGQLFECIERRYLQLKAGNRAAIKDAYEEHLWRRGESSTFVRSADGSMGEGEILGVTERGWLRVETEQAIEEFELKSLQFVL